MVHVVAAIVCTAPTVPGYTLTPVQLDTSKGFAATGECAAGYNGKVTVTACTSSGPFSVRGCSANVCTCPGGVGRTGPACTANDAVLCAKCKAGFGMKSDGQTCEQCGDKAHPEFNDANDSSPCGKHKGCGKNMYFAYSAENRI